MPPNKSHWATKDLRQKNIEKLRAALQNYNKTQSENVENLEQEIFEKSNNLDEYLQNSSKVLVVCRDKPVQMQPTHGGLQNPNMPPGMHHMQGAPMHPGMHAQMHGQMHGQMHNMNQVPMNQMNQMNHQMMGMPPVGMMPAVRRQMYSNPNMHPGSPHLQQQQVPPQPQDEDTMYAVKLAELQKRYIVPLQKLKEKNQQKKAGGEMKRIEDILDVLMTSRKIKLETLINIESVLFKLFKSGPEAGSVEKGPMSVDKGIHSTGSMDKVPVHQSTKHFCQPLIDGVANHACNSSFYHTVRRTFGPALYSQHGDVTLYPPAKRPKKGEPATVEILDSEIERLPPVFKAEIKNRTRGDLEVEVKNVKCHVIPSLTVVIPKKYPDQSPWVKDCRNKLGRAVEAELKNKLLAMSMNCTLTQILLYWDFCIKKVLKQKAMTNADEESSQTRWSKEMKVFCVERFLEVKTYKTVIEEFVKKYPDHKPPYHKLISNWVVKFRTTGSLDNLNSKNSGRRSHSGRRSIRDEAMYRRVRQSVRDSPHRSTRQRCQELELTRSTLRRMLKADLLIFPYHITMAHQTLTAKDKEVRVQMVKVLSEKIESSAQQMREPGETFLSLLWTSDEANFYLNGHVNSRNNIFWGSEKPGEITPNLLHSQKVTVWCAISEKGIIGPFFEENGHSTSMNSDHYLNILECFRKELHTNYPRLHDEMWFQEDGVTAHIPQSFDMSLEWLKYHFKNRIISRRTAFGWPPLSPDISPVSFFLWGYLRDRVYKKNPQSLEALKANIVAELEDIDQETLEKVMQNFALRLKAVLDRKGGQLEHMLGALDTLETSSSSSSFARKLLACQLKSDPQATGLIPLQNL